MQIVKLMMVITIPASQRRELVLILGGGGGNEGDVGSLDPEMETRSRDQSWPKLMIVRIIPRSKNDFPNDDGNASL